MKIDFSGTNSIWMGVPGTDRGAPPIAKSVEFSKVLGREGLHLLGQSLRSAIHFLLLFLDLDLFRRVHAIESPLQVVWHDVLKGEQVRCAYLHLAFA